MRIAVTGATGFIGRHVTGHLAARGDDVIEIARSELEGLSHDADCGALKASLRTLDAVVHLAGRAHMTRESRLDAERLHDDANHLMTTRLFQMCKSVGVRRFIFLSSVSAVGDSSRIDSETTATPTTPYGRSKLAAERYLMESPGPAGCVPIVLRPPGVYGPGMKGNVLTLLKAAAKGIPIPVVHPGPRRSFIYVCNLVDAIGTVLRAQRAHPGIYAVSDADPIAVETLLGIVGGVLHGPVRVVKVPSRLMTLIQTAARVVSAIGLPLNAAAIDRFATEQIVDMSEFSGDFGWVPPYTAVQGWAATATWLNGHLE